MNVALWTGQVFLAVAFFYSAFSKATLSREALMAKGQTGIAGFSDGAIRAIAAVEFAGIAGLVLPGLLHIAPVLTPLAATGFVVIMLLAARIHARRNEWKSVGLNFLLFSIAVAVAVFRFREL